MNRRNCSMYAMAAVVSMVLLAGTARAATNWCNALNPTYWGVTSGWSTVSTAATPNPVVIPGASDTAVFNRDAQNGAVSDIVMAGDRSISGMVFRSTGTTAIKANSSGTSPWNLTLGAGGITITPGTATVKDYNVSAGQLSITLGANQTWMNKSANSVLLQGTPVLGGGNSLTLVRTGVQIGNTSSTFLSATNAVFTNIPSITLADGATLTVVNSVAQGCNAIIDRIADATDIVSYGGTLSYAYVTTNIFTETVHSLRLVKGTFIHSQTATTANTYTNIFTYAGGLNRSGSTATVVFDGRTATDLGNVAEVDRVLLAGQANSAMLGPWAVVLNTGFAAYSTTQYLGSAQGVYGNTGSALATNTSDANGIYRPNATPLLTATADLTVGALACSYNNPVLLALAGHKLTIASGGLTFDMNQIHSISNGTVTAGTGSDTNLFVFTTAYGTNNQKVIDAVIANNVAGKVGLVKSGPYVLTLKQANTYTGNTTINDGTLYLATAGAIASSPTIELLYGNFTNQYAGQPPSGARLNVSDQSSTWTLGSAQTLKGNGAVIGNVIVSGTVAPGADTGMLTVTGNVTFANNSTLQVNVQNGFNAGDKWGAADTWNAGYGRLKVCNTVDLGANAKLDVQLLSGASLAIGDKLFLIDNDGTDPVSGKFKTVSGTVLNGGDVFTTGGKSYQISYTGDLASNSTSGGNDVVVQVVATPASGGTLISIR